MAIEIERKFLVDKSLWQEVTKGQGHKIVQAYISLDPERTVRVRIKGNKGYLTIKGKSEGISRIEHEYEIPKDDVIQMINEFNLSAIDKVRYEIHLGKHIWEVDEFHGANEGLIVAEIELNSEQEEFEKPNWITQDVSDDIRYFNSQLMTNPYTLWK